MSVYQIVLLCEFRAQTFFFRGKLSTLRYLETIRTSHFSLISYICPEVRLSSVWRWNMRSFPYLGQLRVNVLLRKYNT